MWSPPQRSGPRAPSRIASDRRQRLQARRSATGVIGAIGALVVAVEPVWVAHLLLLSLYLSELARLALQLVHDRRGM